ncbi:MAG: hypothetical protein KGV46_02080 [Pasteurella sp.]|nr:hypothetical protein [Pasteurella sp.]
MKKQNSPIIHLRTGEPGAGATLHTINEIVMTHSNHKVFYDNAKLVDLPNWYRRDLFNKRENPLDATVWFIDDFYYDIDKKQFIDIGIFFERLPNSTHIYLVADGSDRVEKEIVKYQFDHRHYIVREKNNRYVFQKNQLIDTDYSLSSQKVFDDAKDIRLNSNLFGKFEGLSHLQNYRK